MRLGEVFAHAIVRRVAAVLVACVLGLIAQCAHAAGCSNPTNTCPISEAFSECQSAADAEAAATPPSNGQNFTGYCVSNTSPPATPNGSWTCRKKVGTSTFGCSRRTDAGLPVVFYYTKGCEAAPPVVKDQGTRDSLPICHNGCLYSPSIEQAPDGGVGYVNFNNTFVGAVTWTATGQTCAAPKGEPWDPKKRTCKGISSTENMHCVNPDGSQCMSTSRGTFMCWGNGQNGPRSTADGKEGANKQNGTTQGPPPSNMKDPTPGGSSTVNVNGGTSTVVNYNGTGSNGGQSDTGTGGHDGGTGGDGDGGGSGGDGDNDGTAGGGGDCTAPPTCSGDPIMCAVLDQQWRTRCGSNKGDENGNGQPDWTEPGEGQGDTPLEGDGTEKIKEFDFGIDMIDDSGFITGDCPELPTWDLGPLGSFDLNTAWWCDMLVMLGYVFLFIAACASLSILVS